MKTDGGYIKVKQNETQPTKTAIKRIATIPITSDKKFNSHYFKFQV